MDGKTPLTNPHPPPPLLGKIERAWPQNRWKGVTLVIGVSGGADSVALLTALHLLAPPDSSLVVAHFNHQLRGAESDDDCRFVQQLAEQFSLQCIVGTPPSIASHDRQNEESWRQQRYHFFRSTCEQLGARYLVTGHTADDRIETMLHNMLRGTGVAGLRGPQMFRSLGPQVVVARPMLDIHRAELITFLESLSQPFRNDSSNLSSKFSRNRLRHEVLPMLRSLGYADIDQALLRLSDNAIEVDQALSSLASELMSQVILHEVSSEKNAAESKSNGSDTRYLVTLDRIKMQSVAWPVIFAMLTQIWESRNWPMQQMSRQHWLTLRQAIFPNNDREAELRAVTTQQTEKVAWVLPGNIHVRVTTERIYLES